MTASELPDGDCRSLPPATSDDKYQACAHFYPEFWGNPLELVLEQKIEPPQGIGFLGEETWFMTKFTADEFPEFVSYHGLQKEENRERLAATFKRPTTWKDYCELVSLDNCTTPDLVVKRAPLDDIEAARMFQSGLYTGHFRYTEKNNCTMYPTNCTGHIANYPCGWSSNMKSNLYYMKIPLDANNGPNGGPNGYTADQLKEMWHAANATRSHLMMAWWSPEPLYQQYLGTDAELEKVVLKPYTRECARARVEWKDECADDLETRVGAPEEACDNPVEPLRKLINVGLREILESPDILEEAHNPAYDVLRLFQIDGIQLGELFELWMSESNPRDAVCKWAVENREVLNSFIPPTYPRVALEETHVPFGSVAVAFGCVATLVVALTAWGVHRNKDKSSIQFAQLDFLSLLLTGSFLVGIGSILLGLPASDATCIASIWFVQLGYTVELVPLIVKVAAINRLTEAARELRRIKIKREALYKTSALIGLCLVIYLACWTALNPPQQQPEYSMTGSTNEYGDSVVDKRFYCSGGTTNAWDFAAVSWNALLLLCASVLAFQSRNVVQQFNESRTLAFLIYSHFVFVVLRIVTFLLTGNVQGSTLNYARSLIYALDQIMTCVIYFLPKLTASDNDDDPFVENGRRISGLAQSFNKSGALSKIQSSFQSAELQQPPVDKAAPPEESGNLLHESAQESNGDPSMTAEPGGSDEL